MWVVKLGGSLQSFPGLRSWVRLIAEQGGGRVVLVPGGGQFADAVRAAQRSAGFDDRTAHGMALFAMEQYGLMLSAMAGNLVPAQSERQIGAALADGHVPIWMPHALASASHDIVPDWSFTSDSLALWLARRLGAELLLLLKSVALRPGSATPETLAAAGLVDTAFAPLARDYAGRIAWLRRDAPEAFRAALDSGNPDGLELLEKPGTETTPRAAARGA